MKWVQADAIYPIYSHEIFSNHRYNLSFRHIS